MAERRKRAESEQIDVIAFKKCIATEMLGINYKKNETTGSNFMAIENIS